MTDATERMKIESATAWRPTPGDTVTGSVVGIRKQTSDYGFHPVLVLDTGEDHYTAVHAFHGVLKNKLYELKPTVGDRLSIGYQGKVDGKERPYHAYTVINPDAPFEPQQFSWDDEEPDF